MVARPLPISSAPMAGGPSTPALAKAVSAGGGLGFLAAGTITAAQLAADLTSMAGHIYAVNVFAPQQSAPKQADLAHLGDLVADVYARYDQQVPAWPTPDLSNQWDAKLQVILTAPTPPVAVSVTFGCFTSSEIERLHAAGIAAWVTVTNPRDAVHAREVGADALVVQGPEAGGHRGTWDISAPADDRPLPELVRAVVNTVPQLPVIAAGGMTTAADVADTLQLPGVQAVSIGSAFLLATEAGTSAANREILHAHLGERGEVTVATRAFSGRIARGIKTAFSHQYPHIPPVYPYVNALLAPLRTMCAARGDTSVAYCLAGKNITQIHAASAAEILASLTP